MQPTVIDMSNESNTDHAIQGTKAIRLFVIRNQRENRQIRINSTIEILLPQDVNVALTIGGA